MSLNYSKENIFGGPVDSEVLKLIQDTQAKFGQQSGFSDQQLQFFNSNTGWVKVTSSVNVRTPGLEEVEACSLPTFKGPLDGFDENTRTDEPNLGSDYLAKKYVLLGGTLYEQSLRTGIMPDTDTARGSYELDDTFGYVPMPGIDSFSIKHAGTYGSIKIATLEFKVNSIQQLTDLEVIFMRPGFSLLVEWGHSIYLDADGEIQTQIQTIGDEYFNLYDKKDIIKEIETLRTGTNYNYEAMYGKVTNFTWKYAKNGEYDCQISITSLGEIMESLRLSVEGEMHDEAKEVSFKEYATKLSEYLYAIKSLPPSLAEANDPEAHVNRLLQGKEEQIVLGAGSQDTVNKDKRDKYQNILLPIQDELQKNDRELKIFSVKTDVSTNEKIDEAGSFKYIPLSNLLACLNVNYTLKSEGEQIVSFNINKEEKQSYTSFLQHLIIDPAVGFIPKNPGTTSIGGDRIYSESDYFLQFAAVGSNADGDLDDLLNICVNVDFIIQVMEQRINSNDTASSTVLNLVTDILTQLSIQGGRINDFDLHHEDEKFQFYVVDRKMTPSTNDLADAVIDVLGLNSIIEDLGIQSSITSEMSSMIAIAAASERSDVSEQLDNMQRWNKGLVDRTLPNKVLREVPKEADKIPAKKILEFLKDIRNRNAIPYTEDDYINLQSTHATLMREFLLMYTQQNKTNLPGIIPIELSLKLKGISGLKIGQGFNITQDILPERYRGNVGFILTEVAHSISDNKWNTELTALMTVSSTYEDSRIKSMDDLNGLDIEQTIFEGSDALSIIGTIPAEERKLIRFPLRGLKDIRDDAAGKGVFGADRKGENQLARTHEGVDYLASPGKEVISPFPGTIRSGIFSKGLPLIEITGTGDYERYQMLIGYVQSNGTTTVNAAQVGIGNVVRLDGKVTEVVTTPVGLKKKLVDSEKGYQEAKDGIMKNHIHVELRFKNDDGNYITVDPTNELVAGPILGNLPFNNPLRNLRANIFPGS